MPVEAGRRSPRILTLGDNNEALVGRNAVEFILSIGVSVDW